MTSVWSGGQSDCFSSIAEIGIALLKGQWKGDQRGNRREGCGQCSQHIHIYTPAQGGDGLEDRLVIDGDNVT